MPSRAFSVVEGTGIVTDEPMALRAIQRIEDHIEACSQNYGAMTATFTEVKDAIKDTNKLLFSFISFVVITVVAFAGYTYVQQQALASQLTAARISQAEAISRIPQVTADRVVAKVAPSDVGN